MITIKKNKNSRALKDAVELLSGVDLSVCFQCKKCSSGCAVAKLTKIRPSEVMRRLHLDAGRELLESDLIWTCASCGTCSARCPMGIDVAAVMDALRQLARIYYRAEDYDTGNLFAEQIVRDFPDSPNARYAQSMLNEVRGGGLTTLAKNSAAGQAPGQQVCGPVALRKLLAARGVEAGVDELAQLAVGLLGDAVDAVDACESDDVALRQRAGDGAA